MIAKLRGGLTFVLVMSSMGITAAMPAGAARELKVPGDAPTVLQATNTHRAPRGTHMLRHWNEIAIDMSGLDHTPLSPGEVRVFGEAFGPARSSRALAIVQIAVFEAVNAISGGYESYVGLPRAPRNTNMEAAVAQAAHDTLNAMFPSQAAACDDLLDEDLGGMPAGLPRKNGIDLGRRAAAAILAMRSDDGSDGHEQLVGTEYVPGPDPGEWRQDPISKFPIAMGVSSGSVRPFVLESSDQFRVPPPPALNSPEYATAYNEVKRLGGDGTTTPTVRTPEQTVIGIYWAYDGTPSLCAPPRLYNQIATQIAEQMGADTVQTARLMALVNVSMADAGIAIWESKYHYKVWRPVTGIRESDPGTGPTGAGDGNVDTVGDPTFSPLGAPASNKTSAVNFTPPFPAYPSGHAGFGGALFQTLRNFFGTDAIPFTFVSDELNGKTKDVYGDIRPLVSRSFSSLSQAEEENGQSRIYLGIHWAFDKTEGIAQGRRVADYVFENLFAPVKKHPGGH